ncbi:MAG: hypothetical protein ACYDG4_13400 [Desulfuromonadaceae bacterium]
MPSIGEEFPKEQARVRRLLETYASIGAPGLFAASLMKISLRQADEAAISGDPVAILRAYEDLRSYKE